MGTFHVRIGLAAAGGGDSVALDALVDTGATYTWIPRAKNGDADRLIASTAWATTLPDASALALALVSPASSDLSSVARRMPPHYRPQRALLLATRHRRC